MSEKSTCTWLGGFVNTLTFSKPSGGKGVGVGVGSGVGVNVGVWVGVGSGTTGIILGGGAPGSDRGVTVGVGGSTANASSSAPIGKMPHAAATGKKANAR